MRKEPERSVLITGASRVFGLALARRFLHSRWRVVSLVRKEKDAIRLKEMSDGRCLPVVADVTDNDSRAPIQQLLESFGTIDVLINNAGIGGESATLQGTTADEVLSLVNVHCLGALRVTQAVFPFMKEDGTIINISSRFGSVSRVSTGQLDDVACSYSYRIAKAAQNMLTQCMCREFKNTGMKICSIHPGRLKTETASMDADKTPEEAAEILYGLLNNLEHGKVYSLFEGTMEW